MSRVKTISHNGKNVIVLDLSKAEENEILKTLKEASSLICQQAPKSVRILTDVTDANYTKPVSDAIKTFSANNSPYVRASAVIGVEGIRYVLLQTVIVLTRREIKTFPTQAAALNYLANA
jgi:hypothetical protein